MNLVPSGHRWQNAMHYDAALGQIGVVEVFIAMGYEWDVRDFHGVRFFLAGIKLWSYCYGLEALLSPEPAKMMAFMVMAILRMYARSIGGGDAVSYVAIRDVFNW